MNRHIAIASAWTLLLIILSLISKGQAEKLSIFDFFGIDKLEHTAFYGVLSFLWVRAFFHYKLKYEYSTAIIFCSGLGIILEYLQKLLGTGRLFEFDDMIANLLGSILGAIAFYYWQKNK